MAYVGPVISFVTHVARLACFNVLHSDDARTAEGTNARAESLCTH